MYTGYLFNACTNPKAGATDLDVWGKLTGGPGNASVVKVGLFGYDITCLANFCAE